MITRIYLICMALLISYLSVGEGFATVKTYTPAPQISLTGTTSDIRFDVAAPLFGSLFSGAYLDTSTQNMRGAFYMSGAGWALMSSGAYQVKINCGIPSLKDILPTTPQCQFTGSGWAENIGELSFANVRYNPSSGTLSGSIGSFAGDFIVDGVSLPLRPVDLIESLTGLTANHITTLTVQSGSEYGDGTWDLKIIPSKNPSYFERFDGFTVGIFSTDLSLADTYTWEVIDPQGSVTTFSSVEVKPNLLSQNFDTTIGLVIQKFCTFDSSSCPDGAIRSASSLIKNGANKIADGASYYDFTLKPRDKYGNRVDTGSVEISYTGSISSIQLPTGIFSTAYIAGIFDPIVFQSSGFFFSDKKATVVIDGTDVSYGIASIAPTDGSNTLILKDIRYTSPTGIVSIFLDTDLITFAKPYTADITLPAVLLLGTVNHFVGSFASGTTEPLTPELITTLLIGDGLFANMSNLVSDPAGIAVEDDIDWMMGALSVRPSSITITSPSATFGFTGTYSPSTAYPELEKLSYQSLIHYQIGGTDVIYPVDADDQMSEYKSSRIKILGQNNARAEYGTISTTSKSRADVFNQIRKSVALLSRGRTSYTDVPYTVYNTDESINNNSFTDKQTLVVIGKDITITENIAKRSDGPLAIIALAKDGVGGNIYIDPSVTTIHASLFAEHAMMTSGDSQLYIGGSLVSGNTLGETAAGICPYYVPVGTCVAKLYDLEEMRTFDGMGAGTASTSPTAGQYPATSMIIEYDMRLQTDPPPGLSQ